ncbi:MAG: SusC/RagA family TonB-linked outer membrane protein [Candidatus Cryptobacteroides sp.]
MKKIRLFFTALMLLAAGSAFAQNITVSGNVTDSSTGEAVPFASVHLKGTMTGVSTDASGNYSITVPAGDGTLVFSSIGYRTSEQQIAGRGVVDARLEPDTQYLDEVVVTAVGIQRSERSLGYSVTKVSSDETVQRAEPDILRALDGKVAGVQVAAPSGDAGGATRITIRGNSSFLGNNQPLYVVDGVPYSNDGTSSSGRGDGAPGAYGSGISTLDPNDIESMSVLKGAAAAVLYGSRAANGVILVTTKSGSKNAGGKKDFEITFNGSYSIETIASLPVYQNTYGQGANFQFQGANGSWGPAFTEGATMDMYAAVAAEYPDLALQLYPDLGGKIPYKAYENNVKDLFKTGGIWDVSLNVRNTGERGFFNVTGSYLSQDSYIPGSQFDRYSFSVGGAYTLKNGVRFGGNISFSYTDQRSPLYGYNQSSSSDGGMSSLARAFIMPRSWDIQNFPYQKQDGSNLLFQLSSQANNPYWAWENDKVNTNQKRTVANFNIGYNFTKWLAIDYTLGYNGYDQDRKTVVNLGSRGYAGKGYIGRSIFYDKQLESTLLLSGEHRFGGFGLKVTLGHNYNMRIAESFASSGQEIINPGIFAINNTKSQTSAEDYSQQRKWGLFADIVLDWKEWLFLNLSARNDVSSTLPVKNRSFFYPAVSASFVFSEAFNIKGDAFTFGKIRASWAKVGNDASPYYVNGTYVTGSPYMGQGLMELPTVSYDPNLKPEFTSEFEVGAELKFLNGRIGFDGTYYNRVSDNQIGAKTSAPSTGYSSYVTNFGSIRNAGWETGLDLYPVMGKNFTWSIYTTFTKNKSKVLSLADGVEKLYIGGDFSNPRPVLIVGQPYGVLEGEKLARDEEGNPLVDPSTGMYINDTETGIIGDPNPKYKLAMTHTFSFYGFTISAMLDYQHGGCVYSSYLTDLLGRGVTKDTEDRLGSRILPGVYGDANTLQPILDADGNKIRNTTAISEADLWFSDGTYSTFAINSCDEVAVYDASVLRLREVVLSYKFPSKWMRKIKLAGAEISIVGRNLWYWAPNVPKYSNYDPTVNSYGETNVQGIDYTSAPSTRRFAFNLKLTF